MDIAIHSVILLLYIGLVFASIFARRSSTAILAYSIMSSVTFFLFYLYNAADVALTEISIGVFLTFFFFYIVHSKTTPVKIIPHTLQLRKIISCVIIGSTCIAIFCLLLYTAFMLDEISLLQNYSVYYNTNAFKETHITNTVTAILASYRGFDTFGETLIIATSSFGLLGILKYHNEITGNDTHSQKT